MNVGSLLLLYLLVMILALVLAGATKDEAAAPRPSLAPEPRCDRSAFADVTGTLVLIRGTTDAA